MRGSRLVCDFALLAVIVLLTASCVGNKVQTPVPEDRAERSRAPAFTTWEGIFRFLPRDSYKNIDWVRAVKEGVIVPRWDVGGDLQRDRSLDSFASRPHSATTPVLDLDVEIVPPGNPFFKVKFSHASHTLWLTCSSCHPGIASKRGSGMAAVFAGEYCGACHGKVSFAPAPACPRCHINLPPPPADDAAEDHSNDPYSVFGDIQYKRPIRGVREIPPAYFSHGKHRLNFRCAACHPAIFQMRTGTSGITMEAIRDEGKFCAVCHNGTVAWQIDFWSCPRCHRGNTQSKEQ